MLILNIFNHIIKAHMNSYDPKYIHVLKQEDRLYAYQKSQD